MPWYRVPFNLHERAWRYAAATGKRTRLQDAVLDMAKINEVGDSPLLAGTLVHLNFGSRDNRKAPPPCSVCGWIAERQCDRIVRRDILVHGEPRRCDAWICSYCTYEPEPGKDLCPKCVPLFKGWLAARTNSTDGEGLSA